MPALSAREISSLVQAYYPDLPLGTAEKFSVYLELLLTWNKKMNLTAIRDPREIVWRHFGESLFAAAHVPSCRTMLDFGSGAGFPGLPIALVRPEIAVTLAEAQNKKASFLREAVRTLNLAVEVWGERVENMPGQRRFDVVALRAVDRPADALILARNRLAPAGFLLELTVGGLETGTNSTEWSIPNSESAILRLTQAFHVEHTLTGKESVPRGT